MHFHSASGRVGQTKAASASESASELLPITTVQTIAFRAVYLCRSSTGSGEILSSHNRPPSTVRVFWNLDGPIITRYLTCQAKPSSYFTHSTLSKSRILLTRPKTTPWIPHYHKTVQTCGSAVLSTTGSSANIATSFIQVSPLQRGSSNELPTHSQTRLSRVSTSAMSSRLRLIFRMFRARREHRESPT